MDNNHNDNSKNSKQSVGRQLDMTALSRVIGGVEATGGKKTLMIDFEWEAETLKFSKTSG